MSKAIRGIRLVPVVILVTLLSSCTQIFSTLNNPSDPDASNYQGYTTVTDPSSITAVNPANGGTLINPQVTVTKVAGATTYAVRVASSSATLASSPLFTGSNFASNVISLSSAPLLNGTTYYWQAGASKDGGTTWGWSSVFSFTTSFTPQGPITIGFGLGTYQTLSFSSSTLTVTVGQSINFVPSFNTGGSNWQWFVNGSIVSTASSLSYTPSTPGTCQISVLVQYYGVLYSGSVTVTGKTHYGVALTLSGTVTTLAGSTAYGSVNGTGSAARFDYPMGITTDGTNLYVADEYNNEIRKVVIATGAVTTLAGSTLTGSADGTGSAARFDNPMGITTDGTNLYVADTYNNEIRKVVIATGVVTTLAGSTTYGSVNGTGSAASFHYPCGITTDGTNIYVADAYNNEIRKVVIATGVVTTLAGSTLSGSADGTGSVASFNYPMGITVDGTNLYVSDTDNNEIRQVVIATGVVTTLAGSTLSGSTNGTGSAARFDYPMGIATDGINLYVADEYNNEIRQVVIATGAVTTLAGSTTYGSVNGTGSAASFHYPCGITTDGTNLYVADEYNNEIRMIQ